MELLIISILILLNGFFALSEIALVSSKNAKLEQLKTEGRKGAKSALKLLKDSENFLSAIQVGITLIGIVTGVYGGLSIADDITPFFEKFDLTRNSAEEISLAITILTITYFSILIGELVPKTIALSNPEKVAVRIAPAITFISIIFYPVVRFMSFSTSLVNRILGIKKQKETLSEGELRHMLKTASKEGIIEQDQNLIHDRVFYFSDKKAKHIMTHRLDIDWIDLDEPFDKIKEAVVNSKHSRLICSRGNLDNLEGVLNVKEFLISSSCNYAYDFKTLTHPLIVPESADINKILNQFKKGQINFCIVVNEYGSIEGIITPHDILENLIGEIPEEGEFPEPDIFVRDDKSFLVSGDAPVEVLDGIFDNHTTDLEKIEYSTVAGFVLEITKKLPQIGDKFAFNDFIIEIVDIDGNRIDKILIRRK